MTLQTNHETTNSPECNRCDHGFSKEDNACEVLSGRSDDGLGTAVVCTSCAKKAGVDVGAFARPAPEVLPELA
ncbi:MULTISPECIES: hypothetical protein [Haloferacaceae]|uniref:Small CPxCG-related zinc finger protein n=2 Tax=Haloferacaceae TaxID=1644056 RepID=A0ABD6DB63_9EURY|nr:MULTISPECIES: hypothetical protein [Halorubraceae]